MTYSSHIFICPFKWSVPDNDQKQFSRQVDLSRVRFLEDCQWQRDPQHSDTDAVTLYDEKNYFFDFVHPVLYDDGSDQSLIRHFIRRDIGHTPVRYHIKHKGSGRLYSLDVMQICLNFYATGVGTLTFYLHNNLEEQSKPEDILRINQYGRRFILPFYADIGNRGETAEYISITGLCGGKLYREDFNAVGVGEPGKPAGFILDLITELATNVEITPVIDDRMFVVGYYLSDNANPKKDTPILPVRKRVLAESDKKKELNSFLYGEKFWYAYVFVDKDMESTCQNAEMHKKLIDDHTYLRWQKYGTFHGITRYSMVMLAKANTESYITTPIETIYTRMVELALVQRASMLRFSGEVTRLSHLQDSPAKLSKKISSLYFAYIRFVNQVYFREITTQEQGVELYDMLRESMRNEMQVEKLDKEMAELSNHISLLENRAMNRQMKYLTLIATIFVPVSFVAAFFSMNEGLIKVSWTIPVLCMGSILLIFIILLWIMNRKTNK